MYSVFILPLLLSVALAAPAPQKGYEYQAPAGAVIEAGATGPTVSQVSHTAQTASVGASVTAADATLIAQLSADVAQIDSVQHVSSTGSGSLASSTSSASAPTEPIELITIVKDERVPVDETGSYSFAIEGSDGSVREETGTPGENGAVVQTGSWSFTLPDGQTFEMTFVADENGFQPQSPFLPPLPEFVLEQIEFAKNNPEPEVASSANEAHATQSVSVESQSSGSASSSASSVNESHASQSSGSASSSVVSDHSSSTGVTGNVEISFPSNVPVPAPSTSYLTPQ